MTQKIRAHTTHVEDSNLVPRFLDGWGISTTALAQGNLKLSSVLCKYHTHEHMHTLINLSKKGKKKTKKKTQSGWCQRNDIGHHAHMWTYTLACTYTHKIIIKKKLLQFTVLSVTQHIDG